MIYRCYDLIILCFLDLSTYAKASAGRSDGSDESDFRMFGRFGVSECRTVRSSECPYSFQSSH